MNGTVSEIIHRIASSRVRLLATTAQLTEEDAAHQPGPDQWSISNIVEHLVLAEHYELNKLWQTMEEARSGKKWSGEHTNSGLSIEEVLARNPKPWMASAHSQPRIGGPLAYWKECLICCQSILEVLGNCLEGLDLDSLIFAHPLYGPLDARQRLELIRLHMDRHVAQIERTRSGTMAR